jgi:beta-glucosidase
MTRLAAADMTVLTNRDATLPLSGAPTVALVGRHAVETIGMGGGSAQVPAPYQVSVAEGLTRRLGDAVAVADGVEVRSRPQASADFITDPVTGEPGLHAWLYAADGSLLDERHHALAATYISLEHVFAQKVARVVLRGRIEAHGPTEVGVFGDGDWAVDVGPHALTFGLRSAVRGFANEIIAPPVQSRIIDLEGGAVIEARVETAHPLGITSADVADAQGSATVDLTAMAVFGLIARPAPRPPEEVIAEAARAAAAADVAVLVVGLTEEQETESVDKTTLRLPGAQDAMVTAVAAAASRTVVVLNAATPVLMPWLEDVDAVLWAGLPGQEAGHAVAAALLGDHEPAGRLVNSSPGADGAAPAWSVTPVDGDLAYAEGPFIGYRGTTPAGPRSGVLVRARAGIRHVGLRRRTGGGRGPGADGGRHGHQHGSASQP